MEPARLVRFYVDPISPYTWLALVESSGFAERHAVRWIVRPVVYAALLDAHGLVGPAESPAKRRYTFHDIARSARRVGRRLVGPPAHPFRSIEALRTLCLFLEDPPATHALAVAFADAAWYRGRDLTDVAVLAEIVGALGFDGRELGQRIGRAEIRRVLHDTTAEAIRRGVFGVPTFELDGELFWGHDRMDQLAARLGGEPAVEPTALRAMLDRPAGARRRRPPGEASG